MNNIVGAIFLVLMAIAAIAIVLTAALPTVDAATKSAEIKSADTAMRFISDAIAEVVQEGASSSRVVNVVVPDGFETIPEEDAVQYSTYVTYEVFQYLARQPLKKIIYVSGNNVNCFEQDENNDGSQDLVMENNLVRAAFTKISRTSPMQSISTNATIISLLEKTGNVALNFTNTTVYVSNFTTSTGKGFSELSKAGREMPHCQVHFFINSSISYDIYYKLYSGADFLVSEVRNIR